MGPIDLTLKSVNAYQSMHWAQKQWLPGGGKNRVKGRGLKSGQFLAGNV